MKANPSKDDELQSSQRAEIRGSLFKVNYNFADEQERVEDEGEEEEKQPDEGLKAVHLETLKKKFIYSHDYKLPHKIKSRKGHAIFSGQNLIRAIHHVSKMLNIEDESVLRRIYDEVVRHEIVSVNPKKESPLPKRTEFSESPKTRKLLAGAELSKKKNSDMNIHHVSSDNGQLKVSCLDSEPASKYANFTRSNSRITPDIQSLSNLDISH
mmetsp:Transcript_10882/g.16514  ORF Transcript_10882/g.16514 Transcript_10882/m.16514 type:complete len:211 (+) Transcript_10882:5601-6233(+)|eukprot:CAMPEP_0170512800 /NCGR_PEP_ID=MMETSP0208-20121228/67047_1 /TAXON_ID=197538 /ORGANISM="Strombidium inclinatum, Strain S3" /LENGTH=210 /DNA_ID=CAMNT_0010796465 /DNA_START=6084 /DNA_END=6716 /DNA_ORIENTATION=-